MAFSLSIYCIINTFRWSIFWGVGVAKCWVKVRAFLSDCGTLIVFPNAFVNAWIFYISSNFISCAIALSCIRFAIYKFFFATWTYFKTFLFCIITCRYLFTYISVFSLNFITLFNSDTHWLLELILHILKWSHLFFESSGLWSEHVSESVIQPDSSLHLLPTVMQYLPSLAFKSSHVSGEVEEKKNILSIIYLLFCTHFGHLMHIFDLVVY